MSVNNAKQKTTYGARGLILLPRKNDAKEGVYTSLLCKKATCCLEMSGGSKRFRNNANVRRIAKRSAPKVTSSGAIVANSVCHELR